MQSPIQQTLKNSFNHQHTEQTLNLQALFKPRNLYQVEVKISRIDSKLNLKEKYV